MKYAPHLYAEAFHAALAANPLKERELLKHLVASLEKNGDRNGMHKVVEALERILVKKRGGSFVELQSARPLTASVVESFKKIIGKEDHLKTSVDPSLVAGVRMLVDDSWSLDATLKRRLEKLFNAI